MGSDRNVGSLAGAVGVVALISVVCLVLFFTVGKPFGAINDATIGLVGLLTSLLAIVLERRGGAARSTIGTVASGLAAVGGAIVVLGLALVISGATGFLLAGLVEGLGFALIGLWLIVLNRSMAATSRWPSRLRSLGMVAGIVMAIGIVMIPGIAMGIDDMDTAPGWVWIGFVGWLGIFFLYPLWSIWFGTVMRTGEVGDAVAPA